MNALVPASLARKIEADILGKGLANKSASVSPSSSLARSTGHERSHSGRYGAPADGQHAHQDPGDGRYVATALMAETGVGRNARWARSGRTIRSGRASSQGKLR